MGKDRGFFARHRHLCYLRPTAPAIRTDRTAALHNPLQTITAFNDSNPVGQMGQGGICVAVFARLLGKTVSGTDFGDRMGSGSGQFAASALDTLSAARNRVTGKPALSRARVGGLRFHLAGGTAICPDP